MIKKLFFTALSIALAALVFGSCRTGVESEYVDTGRIVGGEWIPAPDNTSRWAEVFPNDFFGTKVYFLAPNYEQTVLDINGNTEVIPAGNDETGDGSKEKPWFSIPRANQVVGPGDTVYLRRGTYYVTRTGYGLGEVTTDLQGTARTMIALNKSGTKGSPITYAGYPPDERWPGEPDYDDEFAGNPSGRPVLDFFGYIPGIPPNATMPTRTAGMRIGSTTTVRADWTWIRCIDFTGLEDYTGQSSANAYVIQISHASHVTLEQLRMYRNAGTGVYTFP